MLSRLILMCAEFVPKAVNRFIIAPLKIGSCKKHGKDIVINPRVRAIGWENISLGKR